ncbi:MAG TPA: outer membrane protein assembly factor BamB [Steroidobacteraceae bacterium]|nr:outer membrane protein assembly factor BamB [Steroidobacteraceae bacterium]
MSLAALVGALLCAALLCAGCSYFTSKAKIAKKKAEDPMELVSFPNHIELQRVWSVKVSGEVPRLRLGLDLAIDDERVFAASHKGEVEAFDLKSGRRLWSRKVKAPLAGGPAAGLGLVVVGSSKGEVIALSEADGKPSWRIRINAEILSAAAIGRDLVVVRGVDGRMHGLSIRDGSEVWVAEQQVPRLSLRGTSPPVLVGDLAIAGFDNGRVAAVTAGNGSTAWDTAVGQSHGSTELQRLIDVDAPVVADGDDLFAVAYQGRVTRMARETGQLIWARDMSSYRGLAVDDNAVYISTADGNVVRVDRKNGTEQWTQKALARRQLTAPVIYRGRVVVADAGGVLHWLDPATGDFVARAQVGSSVGRNSAISSKGIALKKRVSNAPVVAGGMVLAFSDNGVLSAYSAPLPADVAAAEPTK